MVHLKSLDRCPADGRPSDEVDRWNHRPGEVIVPGLLARVIQKDILTRFGVFSQLMRPLMSVAMMAGEREIPGLGQPAGRPRQDMVHWEASDLALAGELAILKTAGGPGEHEIAKGL
jgi:hypothetical protein